MLLAMVVVTLGHVGQNSSARAAVLFQDADFVASDWGSNKYVDATSGQGASFVATTLGSGGTPGSYRQVLLTFPEGGRVRIANLRDGINGFRWNPSTQGAFASIDYSFDLIMTNYFNPAPIPSPTEQAAVGYSLLLYQSGNYYTAPIVVVSTNDNKQWISIANGNLLASQFRRINPTTGFELTGFHPDFSSTGGEIIFGYDMVNSHGSQGVYKATESGIDNYRVRLNDTASPPAVPEPGTILVSLGLLSYAGADSIRRRSQRRKD